MTSWDQLFWALWKYIRLRTPPSGQTVNYTEQADAWAGAAVKGVEWLIVNWPFILNADNRETNDILLTVFYHKAKKCLNSQSIFIFLCLCWFNILMNMLVFGFMDPGNSFVPIYPLLSLLLFLSPYINIHWGKYSTYWKHPVVTMALSIQSPFYGKLQLLSYILLHHRTFCLISTDQSDVFWRRKYI